jgi:photosystem II stability/assembly factor-like uncharacterized protein
MAVASVFLDDSLPAGLYLSADGGGLEACTFWGERSYNCHSVHFHPHDNSTLLASIEPDGTQNGIWRSRDFGKSWEHLTRGLPSGEQFGRISLAFAPSDPDVIYALAANRAGHVLGVFRSTNGGNVWRKILNGARHRHERQMFYNNTLAVHPRRPDCMIWGGMHLFRTDDAGHSWRRITSDKRGKRDYVHSDHHALLWPEDELIISGNDGGVAVSRDGGRRWRDSSQGMVSTMFYNIAAAPSDGRIFGGGTQDNGTLIAGVGKEADGAAGFTQVVPGDGAWMAFDHSNAHHVFATATPFMLYRHEPGKPWGFDIHNWKLVKPRNMGEMESQERQFTVVAMEPAMRRGVKKLWAGSDRLWRTDDNGRNWKAVSLSFDGSPISAIEISSARQGLMFVGTTNGGIFRSMNGGVDWSQSLSAVDIPARAITSIACHPKFHATVVVTVASSGVLSSGVKLSTGEGLPYSHIFLSKDGGNTWRDLDGGALPNVVFYSALWQRNPPYQLFVAGDAGVWAQAQDVKKGGFFDVSGSLPSVIVSGLAYDKRNRTLMAATYGRGIWRILIPGELKPAPVGSPPEPLKFAMGLRLDPSVSAPIQLTPGDGAAVQAAAHFDSVILTVQEVQGAIGYGAEYSPRGAEPFTNGWSSPTAQIRVDSPGRDGGKWRVWAILPGGYRSAVSPWRSFTFRT